MFNEYDLNITTEVESFRLSCSIPCNNCYFFCACLYIENLKEMFHYMHKRTDEYHLEYNKNEKLKEVKAKTTTNE